MVYGQMLRRELYAAVLVLAVLGLELNAAEPAKAVRFVSWGGIGGPARLEAAARIGVDTHRLPVTPWPDANGRYDFSTLDTYLPLLHKAGIKAIVHFFSHGVPDWFWQRHPEAQPRNAEGKTERWAGSPWNPLVREEVRKGILATLKHLEEQKLLSLVDGVDVGVGMEGQLSYLWGSFWAFDPYAVMSYRWYLRGLYGNDIAKLNVEWGTRHRLFSEIVPPKRWSDTPQCRVFLDWYRENVLDMAEELSEVVAQRFHPPIWYWVSHFIAPNERPYAARYPIFYMKRLRGLGRADVVHVSVAPGWQTKEEVAGLKALGLPVIGEIYIEPTPEQQREHARLAWQLGCDGFFVGVLENLAQEDGTLTPAGRETERIIHEWRAGKAP